MRGVCLAAVRFTGCGTASVPEPLSRRLRMIDAVPLETCTKQRHLLARAPIPGLSHAGNRFRRLAVAFT